MSEIPLSQTFITGKYHFFVIWFTLPSSTIKSWLPPGWALAIPDPAIFPHVPENTHPVAMELGHQHSIGTPSQPSFTRFDFLEAKIAIPALKRLEDDRILMYKKIIYMDSILFSLASTMQGIPSRSCQISMTDESYTIDDIIEVKITPNDEDKSALGRLQRMTIGDWSSGKGGLTKQHWYDWENAEFMRPIKARVVLRDGAVNGWALDKDVIIEEAEGMVVSANMRMT